MTAYCVGYFVGSLAKASINRKLAKALVRLAPAELTMREIPIGDLPLYSYDYDAAFPPVAEALKQAIAHFGADPVWATVRPPLQPLTAAETATFITELHAIGFTMPGLPHARTRAVA